MQFNINYDEVNKDKVKKAKKRNALPFLNFDLEKNRIFPNISNKVKNASSLISTQTDKLLLKGFEGSEEDFVKCYKKKDKINFKKISNIKHRKINNFLIKEGFTTLRLTKTKEFNLSSSKKNKILEQIRQSNQIKSHSPNNKIQSRNNSLLYNLLSDNSNSHSNSNMTSVSNVNTNPIEVKREDNKNNGKKSKKKIYVSKSQGDIYISGRNNTNRIELKKKAEEEYALYQEKLKNIHKMILKPKTITRNELYEKFLDQKKSKNVSKSQIWDNNLKYIDNLKERVPTYKKFCRPCKPGEEIIETPKQILFCPTKRNYFDSLVKKMREKYISDKKHFYSYSNYSLALSFPMIDTNRNEEYIKYLENKKKWKNGKDFERYKQPEREKIYFPKIQNIL